MWKSPCIADRVTDLDDYTVVVTVCACVIGEVDGFPHKDSLNNFQLYITGLHLHLSAPNEQLM